MTALLGVAVVLVLGNGFFVGAEFAVLAARRSRLEAAAGTSRRARTTLRAIEQLPLMISGCQFGITLCSLGLGALGEPVVARLLTGPAELAHVPDAVVHPLALAVALTLVSAVHMLIGEMVPKNLALAGPESAALLMAPPLVAFVGVFRPVIVALTAVATGIIRLFGVQPVSEVGDPGDREGVAALIAESRAEGLLPAEQHELLRGALSFEERTAAAVLLPLPSLVTVPPTATPADIETLTVRTGYSRFPVQEAGGALLGYVHLADVLETDEAARQAPVDRRWIRSMTTIRPSDLLQDVLARLQRTGAHLGVVVGDDGVTLGLVALEDVLEELVGEVRDSQRRITR